VRLLGALNASQNSLSVRLGGGSSTHVDSFFSALPVRKAS
jgi:hypothetical protein